MKPIDAAEAPVQDTIYLFSEEEIQNISDLLTVLKKIRIRLIKEGIDIDKFTK